MLGNIIEELIAYNPAAGAVFGVELVRMGHMAIYADDGSRPWQQMAAAASNPRLPPNGDTHRRHDQHMLETVRAPQRPEPANLLETVRQVPPPAKQQPPAAAPGKQRAQTQPQVEASGEIVIKNKDKASAKAPSGSSGVPAPIEQRERSEKTTAPGHAAAAPITKPEPVPDPHRVIQTPIPPPSRRAGSINVPPPEPDDPTTPELDIRQNTDAKPTPPEPRGAILGIGMAPIGSSSPSPAPTPTSAPVGVMSGEIHKKIAPGGRVLVPGPGGLMQSATVRQLLQGYYELEVGGSGETIWVPINGVVPE